MGAVITERSQQAEVARVPGRLARYGRAQITVNPLSVNS